MADFVEFKAFLSELQHCAAEVIRPYHLQDVSVERKADESPVTIADREAEAAMRKLIEARYPEHGILGEEHGRVREDAEYCWILDPIDGTKSFVAGVPLFTTLIALLHHGKPVLGGISQPITGEYLIGDGQSCELNGKPVQARDCPIGEATINTTDPSFPHPKDRAEAEHKHAGWKALCKHARLVRCWGDGYGYLLVATGRSHLMLDPEMEAWDILPLVPVIEGAGARITDWQGGPIVREDGTYARCAIAAPPGLHAEALAHIASV